MRRMVNLSLWSIGLAVVLVVYFLVPIGRFTLFEHTLRIAATEPAQELGEELNETGEELSDRAHEEWETRREIREAAERGEPAPSED